ncbi:MAG: hypothetical protein EXQ70_06125 [Solirubrobacterales bacterium]|nr:hypothetical protein [Solirubrobacterales bacterium]
MRSPIRRRSSCANVAIIAAIASPVGVEGSAGQLSATNAHPSHRAKEGRHHGRPPYGYKVKHRDLIRDAATAPIVERIYREAAGGKSQRAIARGLNEDGIKPKRAKSWTQSGVGLVLRNPTYRGAVIFNDEEHEGLHEAIIEPELWERVAGDRAATARSRKGGPGRGPAGPHLFTKGLLRCGHCGGAMAPRTDPGRKGGRAGKTREEYRCLGRDQNGLKSCPQTPVPRAPLDAAAFAYFKDQGVDLEELRKQLSAAIKRQRAESAALLDAAEREERKASEAVERVRRDYTDGKIEAEEWRELKPGLESEHEAAQAALAQAREREAKALAAEDETPGAEETAVLRLAAIQAAIAGKVADASGIDAVRLGLRRTFEEFLIFRTDQPGPDPDSVEGQALASFADGPTVGSLPPVKESEGADEWIVCPVPLPAAIEGLERMEVEGLPLLNRQPLTFADNEPEGLTT